VTTARRPARRTDLVVEELDGELVVLHPEDHTLHVLDGTATVLWKVVDGASTIAEIAADVSEVFGIPLARAQNDVGAFVTEMDRLGLLAT
jgi:hypothetical protein